MIETDEHDGDNEIPPDVRDRPAVAIFDRAFSNAAVGAVVRANHQGYHAFVVTRGIPEADREFVESLDVTVIEVECVDTHDEAIDEVRREARTMGFPGVLLQTSPAHPVDFASSVEGLEAGMDYVVEAVRRSSIECRPEVLAAIPAYNESATIEAVVSDALSYADEVLLVDDGSTDETADRARQAGATVVEHGRNRGYGAALKTVFVEAVRCQAETVVVLDGDGQHAPADIPDLVEELREGDADVAIGSRFVDEADGSVPLYRRFGLRVINELTNFSLGENGDNGDISDTQSGFRAYSRRAIASLAQDESLGDEMGVSTDILHHVDEHGYDIAETGISVDYGVAGPSTLNPLRHGLQLVNNLLRVIEHKRPVLTLSVPGLLSVLFSLAVAFWAFSNYLEHGEVSLPLAVMATFAGVVGVFLIMTGIVLHSVNHLYQGETHPNADRRSR